MERGSAPFKIIEGDRGALSSLPTDEPTKIEGKKKKRGKKAQWSKTLFDDLVDIIISSDYCKQKLIFTNTKNQRNGEIYSKELAELTSKELTSARKEDVPYNITQLRTKFKKPISECKCLALRIKIGTRSVHVGSRKEVSQNNLNYNCTFLLPFTFKHDA